MGSSRLSIKKNICNPNVKRDEQTFKEIYDAFDFDSYVSLKLVTKDALKKIHTKKPLVIKALQELHVTAALGVIVTPNCPILSSEEKITIRDLEQLEPENLNGIIHNCSTSVEVIKVIKDSQQAKEKSSYFSETGIYKTDLAG